MFDEQGLRDTFVLFGIASTGYGAFMPSLFELEDREKDSGNTRRMRIAETIVTILVIVAGWWLANLRGNGRPLAMAVIVACGFVGVYEYTLAKAPGAS